MGMQLSDYAWVSVFFLILLGNLVIMSTFDAQGSADCNRQKSSSRDCQTSSDDDKRSNNKNSGNIQDQIPSVLPFP